MYRLATTLRLVLSFVVLVAVSSAAVTAATPSVASASTGGPGAPYVVYGSGPSIYDATSHPTVIGEALLDTLCVNPGSWALPPAYAGDAISYAYQWQEYIDYGSNAVNTPIGGATGDCITAQGSALGAKVYYTATVTANNSSVDESTSAQTSYSDAFVAGVPNNTVQPTISDISGHLPYQVGDTFCADPGVWPEVSAGYRYQWYLGTTLIPLDVGPTSTIATSSDQHCFTASANVINAIYPGSPNEASSNFTLNVTVAAVNFYGTGNAVWANAPTSPIAPSGSPQFTVPSAAATVTEAAPPNYATTVSFAHPRLEDQFCINTSSWTTSGADPTTVTYGWYDKTLGNFLTYQQRSQQCLAPWQGINTDINNHTTGPLGSDVEAIVYATNAEGTSQYVMDLGTMVNPIVQDPSTAQGLTFQGTPYSGQLAITGSPTGVVYSQSTGGASVTVTTSGAITSLTSLAPGTYTATGTATDAAGDEAYWSFTLTVDATNGQLVQSQNTSADSTAAGGQVGFPLSVANPNTGTVTYTENSGQPDLTLRTSSGQTYIVVNSGLAPGYYTASGTDSDTPDGFQPGTWTFTVHIVQTLVQSTNPTQVVVEGATVQSTPLALSNTGVTGVTYSLTSAPIAGISLDPAGNILTTSAATPGLYQITGNVTDANGDTGSWQINLQVKVVLAQASANTTDTVAAGTAYAGQLVVPNVVGALSDNQLVGNSTGIVVSSIGAISAPNTLVPGVYTVGGNMSDGNGDQGSWTFTLTVTLGQSSPTTITVPFGTGYSSAIGTIDPTGAVTFTEDPSPAASEVVVDSSGNITAASTLPPGTYAVTGTMTDSAGTPHSGPWQFTLTVTSNGVLNQSSLAQHFIVPLGTTAVGAITTDSSNTVTYTEASSPLSSLLVVDSSGNITIDPSMTSGVYTVVGTDYDTAGYSGTWVVTVSIQFTQTSSASATVVDGAGYSSALTFSGNAGAYSVGQFSPTYGITVDSTGNIVAPTSLAPGTYPLSGYAGDSIGNWSYWNFTLTVGAAPTPTPPAGVPSATFGTPSTGLVTPTAPTVVQLTSGTSSAAVTVPAGALPVGTALDVYPVTNASSLAGSIPSGQSYVLSFAVAWQSPGGTVPTATTPLSMTITDPSIVAGDTIYEVTSSGVTKVGTATVNGSVTVTFTTDPTFVLAKSNSSTTTTTTTPVTTTTVPPTPSVSIVSGKLHVKKNAVAMSLRCTNAPCSGVAELVKVSSVKVKNGKKVSTKKVTSILARAAYSAKASSTITVSLHLMSAGISAFAHASTRAVSVTASVSLRGGVSRTKGVSVA